MVNFELKLEDNKVAVWSDKYIDYSKIKKLFSKITVAVKSRENLEKRHPDLAKEFKASYKRQLSEETQALISTNLNQLVKSISDSSAFDENKEVRLSGDENLNQLVTSIKPLFSIDEISEPLIQGSTVDETRDLVSDNSTVHSYGSLRSYDDSSATSSYVRKLQKALEAEDLVVKIFVDFIYAELSKVNEFYQQKLDELKERFYFLADCRASMMKNNEAKTTNDKKSILNAFKKSSRMLQRSFSVAIIGNDSVTKSTSNAFYESDEEDNNLSNDEKASVMQIQKETESMKQSISDLYRRTQLLSNYAIINTSGLLQSVKKFRRNLPDHMNKLQDIKDERNICNGGAGSVRLSNEMEKFCAEAFCDGSINDARAIMLPKKGDGLELDWTQLRLGYRLGICTILCIWVCWDCLWNFISTEKATIGGLMAFPVFRAIGGLLLIHWFWALSVFVWSRYRINYVYLFDFDPRNVDTPLALFKEVTRETIIYYVLMLLYYKAFVHEIPDIMPPGYYPLILVLYAIKCLVFPLRKRAPLWKAIGRVITAPCTPVIFFHTYVADVFTSMVKIFQDLLWTGCFIISGDFLYDGSDVADFSHWHKKYWYKHIVIPIICLFPLVIRFNQCLRKYAQTGDRCPNIPNAFKYAMSQTVTLFGAFHPIYLLHTNDNNKSAQIFQFFWTLMFVMSSLYSYIWDVYMDWGLGSLKFNFLGPRLMYPSKVHYYGVIGADLILRFMWVASLIPPNSGGKIEIPSYLYAVFMSLELLRRTLWGFFRLENEHRHSSAKYNGTQYVPLHFTTGIDHKYRENKKQAGWSVLGEIGVVTAVVAAICVGSVVTAQKSLD